MPKPIDHFVTLMALSGYSFGGPTPEGSDVENFNFYGNRPGLPDFQTMGRLMPFAPFNALMASQHYLPCEVNSARDDGVADVALFQPEDPTSGRLPRAISVRRVDGRDYVSVNSVVQLFQSP